jgi:hypothetical protein
MPFDFRQRLIRRTGPVLVMCYVAAGLPVLTATPAASDTTVQASYVYTLSSFTGPIRQDWSRIAVDRERNETYAIYQNTVRVFNESGMEVYHFGDNLEVGHIVDITVDDRGDILLLAYKDGKPVIVRCDYRGRPRGEIQLEGVPAEFGDFRPNRIAFRRGQLHLASSMGLAALTAERDGTVVRAFDLFRLFELEEHERGSVELGGFAVDDEGNLLLTAPVLFRAFVISPSGDVQMFGKPGSAPGKFNIAGGIARDPKGNFLVVDRLKGAVLVFDPKFNFITQFASRGYKPGELIFPDSVAVDDRNNVFVTQAGRRGISVFKLTYR